MKQTPT
jgi:hypothetical protein